MPTWCAITVTGKTINPVDAGPAVGARFGRAIINVLVAKLALTAGITLTSKLAGARVALEAISMIARV